ncbi:symmetrical bis(5'-nucleosyl)-tetraphosphatase [Shewanella submarina]|uniref:Bis(5'-nucleosyl)-tetraphosphatase, symmetrical n=1 Tax=Shewanella submarina TaxID=2016376 RepID=A0ABV7GE38_9GAMM|nr:symmetrical bis(5'-nucleosyl)-tetraphosphatase [Shewanella submarina]
MAHYFVGDLQGCYDEFRRLLAKVEFNPSRDQIWAVGDLVARGPGSLDVLRFFAQHEGAAHTVLGNHDLHLLAVQGGLKRAKPSDKLDALLQAEDIRYLIDFLREQPLVHHLPQQDLVVTHAGVPPQWDLDTLLKESAFVSKALKRPDYLTALIAEMYGTDVDTWSPELKGLKRRVYCINALTRMRFLHADGRLDFDCKMPPSSGTHGDLAPWFNFPSSLPETTKIVFGHWAALMGETHSDRFQALDTGCCWGEHMTILHLETGEKITQNALKRS